MSTALARVQNAEVSLEPRSYDDLERWARLCVEQPQVAMKIKIAMRGRDFGFSLSQSEAAFHDIKGKIVMTADGAVAACLSRKDVCEYFKPVKMGPESVTWETKRVGQTPVQYTYTKEQARRAQIWSQMYEKHPERMLSARAKMYLARDVYADIFLGIYDENEAREFAPEVFEPRRVVIEAEPESAPRLVEAEPENAVVAEAATEPTVDEALEVLKKRLSDTNDYAHLQEIAKDAAFGKAVKALSPESQTALRAHYTQLQITAAKKVA